jgi:CRP-like cAMP-binding protein
LYASLVEAAFLPLRVRCARVLHSLMTQYGIHRDGQTEITLKLSQEDLADMIGRTRQSVNKELKALERDGVLRMQYSHFVILNEAHLTEIALSEGVSQLPERL